MCKSWNENKNKSFIKRPATASNPFSFAAVYCHFITTLFIAQCPFSSSAINSNSLTLSPSKAGWHRRKNQQRHVGRKSKRAKAIKQHASRRHCVISAAAYCCDSFRLPSRLDFEPRRDRPSASFVCSSLASLCLIFLNDNVFSAEKTISIALIPFRSWLVRKFIPSSSKRHCQTLI